MLPSEILSEMETGVVMVSHRQFTIKVTLIQINSTIISEALPCGTRLKGGED